MSAKRERLMHTIRDLLGGRVATLTERLGEVTLEVSAEDYLAAAQLLRDEPALRFQTAIDLCGIDYQTYGDRPRESRRFGIVVHLLSLEHNWRLRLRGYCTDDAMPMIASLHEVWPGLTWFEREAFDLFGILFDGHPDLRRILTDYGFIGHPFRKDFPLSGTVEMRYDPEQKRVIYQPVTIEPREVIPRVVREEHYAERVRG